MNDAEIDRLEAADQLEAAAALAQSLGQPARASALFERACDFDSAAKSALAHGDYARAFELSALAKNVRLEAQACEGLTQDVSAAERAAASVEARGLHASAARLWLALDAPGNAARCFENAGDPLRAAQAHRAAQEPRGAARCLETLLRVSPDRHDARLLLGEILTEHGRARAAVRSLQLIPADQPEYAAALTLLAQGFSQLGMHDAAEDAKQRLGVLGGPVPPIANAQPTTTQPETVLFGRYRVVREVARTPTARVLEATDRISGARVALKIFAISTLRDSGRDALRRFEREAEVLSGLRHPSILELLAYLPDGPAVVLPWMAGGSFSDLLARGPVAPARAAEITIAVLSALGEAHRRGILHRDVKPANVLFDEAGGARLADFGTAHVSDSAATVTAGVIGTLGYMAPEQRSGAPANVRSDIYGAGALLAHGLTGAPPDAGLGVLSRDLTEAHQSVLDRLIGEEAKRPADTGEAIALMRSVPWPVDVPQHRVETPPIATTAREYGGRLRSSANGRWQDSLLGRDVLVVAAQGAVYERALAFARADHPALASVLSHQADHETVWVEDFPIADPAAPLTEGERATLSQALEALHRAGAAHGAVDRKHLRHVGDQVLLRFPMQPYHHDPERDLVDLATL